MKALGNITAFLMLMALSTLVSGWAISTLWAWFVVPLGVVAIGFWHALGLSCLIVFFKLDLKKADPSKFSEVLFRWMGLLATEVAIVGFGWVYHSLM